MFTDFALRLAEFVWMIEEAMTSVILFGEYPRPIEEDYE
jgi:hypothetical protein